MSSYPFPLNPTQTYADGTPNDEGGFDLDIQVSAGPTKIAGSFQDDRLVSANLDTSPEDTVGASEGNDSVNTGTADDFVVGGFGDDVINTGQGNDTIIENDNHIQFEGDGNDILFGGQGSDLISDNSGSNVLSGDLGNDTLTAGSGSDTMFGGQGTDSISGGGSNDSIWGGQQADTINGGAGNDFLSGDLGADSITGGAGTDTFAFQFYEDEGFDEVDTVTDFASGSDKLAIDAEVDPNFSSGDTLPASEFATVAGTSDAAIDANEAKIIYDTESGIVYHNPSGNAGDLNPVVNLEDKPDINNTDFEFF
jgi:Ca2+-binding RTX toxin-like protein